MDLFKIFLLIIFSVLTGFISLILYRINMLLKKTEEVISEFRKSIEITNNELPNIIKEIQNTTAEIAKTSTEIRTVANKANKFIDDTVLNAKNIKNKFDRSNNPVMKFLPYLKEIKSVVSFVTISYGIFSKIKNFRFFRKSKNKK